MGMQFPSIPYGVVYSAHVPSTFLTRHFSRLTFDPEVPHVSRSPPRVDIYFHNVPNVNKTAERQRSRTTNKGLRDSGHTQAYDLYRRTSRSSTTFCRLLGQAFSRGTAWTAAPDKQMRLARTHRPRRRLSRRTPGLAVAFMCARQASGAAKCKPHALHSAKQESTDFRRARKLGECHELVHQLL